MHAFANTCSAAALLLAFASCSLRYGDDRMYPDRPVRPAPVSVTASYLRSAIDRDPDVAENYLRLADIRLGEGKLIEARALLQTGLQKAPAHHALLKKYAELHIVEDLPADALNILAPLRNTETGDYGYHLLMARAFAALGRIDSGLDHINEALAIYRRNWESNYVKGQLLLLSGDSLAAYGYFSESYSIRPNSPAFEGLMELGIAKVGLPEAAASLERHREEDPADAVLLYWEGNWQEASGNSDSAAVLLRRYAALRPDDARGHLALGYSQLQLYRSDSALACAARALDLKPEYAPARLLRVRALEQGGQLFTAWTEMQLLLKSDSTSSVFAAEARKLEGKIAYLRLRQRREEVVKSTETLKTLTPIKRAP
jgi:tetratricopeptide (TPR) repeat protein